MIDVDAWIDGAKRTHRAVTVYQRADLIADLDSLTRQISIAESAKDADTVAALTAEWEQVAAQFSASGLEIRVRGLSGAEMASITAQSKLDKVDALESAARMSAAAIVEPEFTVPQLLALQGAIGEAQMGLIVGAWSDASTRPPQVNDHG